MKKIQVCVLLLAVAASANLSSMAQAPTAREATKKEAAAGETREIYGTIERVKGTLITLRTRTGDHLEVDAKQAIETYRSAPLVVGRALAIKGTMDKKGVLHAEILQRAKDSPALWPADR